MSTGPQTIIGVPGKWRCRSDIADSISSAAPTYRFANDVIQNVETNMSFSLEVHEHDPGMREAFEIAGRGQFASIELNEIDRHTFTLYLISQSGSIATAKSMLSFANALIEAGGLGVKIESSGVAHQSCTWNEICADDSLEALVHAYVTFVQDQQFYYSCGMHNLGLPDAMLESDLTSEDAIDVLYTFSAFQLVEHPDLENGDTFALEEEGHGYVIAHEPCTTYESEDLFHNPYGIWRLEPAEIE